MNNISKKSYKPYAYTLVYLNEYNTQESFQGTAKQVIKYILDQQTV